MKSKFLMHISTFSTRFATTPGPGLRAGITQCTMTTGEMRPNVNEIEPNKSLGIGLARTGTLAETKTAARASAHRKNAVFSTSTWSHPRKAG
jgi:hypothetical protein